jgi:hypothetical protein
MERNLDSFSTDECSINAERFRPADELDVAFSCDLDHDNQIA